ncbi:hypothetical protein Ddye_032732 [Dipteronia dyeriana]|uniref:Secreted protein n=1 Tax=Dipteronia dyeriana TaxID=168575 RepID=A0AAD9TDD3_9ROSI|nr:hypothetical protein Ddye_032732 [Dipteronia dyeriana]
MFSHAQRFLVIVGLWFVRLGHHQVYATLCEWWSDGMGLQVLLSATNSSALHPFLSTFPGMIYELWVRFVEWLYNVHAGVGVVEECYLVDPASSHMLVSKIKPCMFKKLVVGPWVGRPVRLAVCTGRLVPSAGDALLALIGRVVPPALLL